MDGVSLSVPAGADPGAGDVSQGISPSRTSVQAGWETLNVAPGATSAPVAPVAPEGNPSLHLHPTLPLEAGRVRCTARGCAFPAGRSRRGFSASGLRAHTTRVHGNPLRRVSPLAPLAASRRIAQTPMAPPVLTPDLTAWLQDPVSSGWDFLKNSVGLCRRNVPISSRKLWARTVGFLALACQSSNSSDFDWWALLSLPRLCLPRKHNEGFADRPQAYKINFLLSLALQGDFSQLIDLARWREAQVSPTLNTLTTATVPAADAPVPVMHIADRDMRRANLMMQMGRPSKALAALTGGGSVSLSEDVIEALQDLHPMSGAIAADENTELQNFLENFEGFTDIAFFEALAAKVIGSCPKASAPGCSGWTFEMISVVKHVEEAWGSFARALAVIAQGRLPAAAAAFLRASRLVPIRKAGSDPNAVRPIAVGEIFPRFVGRCLCKRLAPTFKEHFAPAQFGVATPAGTEMCIKAMIAHFAFLDEEGSEDTVILGMDAVNAFNSASTGKALLEVSKIQGFQCLLPMLNQFYGETAPLHIFEGGSIKATLESVSGVRQGDPFGSFLFARLIHEDLAQVHDAFLPQGVLVLAYLDDIFIVGPRSLALDAAHELAQRLNQKNLKFGKNKLFAPSPRVTDLDEGRPGLTFETQDCSKFLGAFLGSGANQKLVTMVTEKISTKCNALIEFARHGNAFTALQLLMACVGNIPNYFLRMMPPSVTEPMAITADRTLIDAFLAISGLASTHSSETFGQDGTETGCVLRMPQAHGGFGLPSQATLGRSAYIASWLSVVSPIATRFPHLKPTLSWLTKGQTDTLRGGHTPAPLVQEAVEGLAQQRAYVSNTLHLAEELEGRDLDREEPEEGDQTRPRFPAREKPLQQVLSTREGQIAASTLHTKIDALDRTEHTHAKAWFNGLSGLGRAAYLHAPPCRGTRPLSNAETEFAVRRHFHIPLRDSRLRPRCACGAHLDPHGDHADVCPLLADLRTQRHDLVNQKGLMEPAQQVKLKPRREVPGLVQGTRGRPADCLIESSLGLKDAGDAWLCFDVVGCTSYSEAQAHVAARHPGGAMARAVGRKIRQAIPLRASCHDLLVIPMAFESHGVLHEHWGEIYHLFARHWVRLNNRSKREGAALVRMWTANISLTIQRAQHTLFARMLQNQSLLRHGDVPHSIRPLEEGVVELADACLPDMERGCVSLTPL